MRMRDHLHHDHLHRDRHQRLLKFAKLEQQRRQKSKQRMSVDCLKLTGSYGWIEEHTMGQQKKQPSLMLCVG